MHILEIPSFFPPYGGEFCLEQARALHALGHDVRVLSNVQLSIKRSVREFITLPLGRHWNKIEGVAVYQSYMRGIPKVVRPNVRRWVKIVQSMFHEYVSRHGRPDVLHAHCSKWAGYAAMLISQEWGIPYVVTEHLSSMVFKEEFGEHFEKAWQIPMLMEAYARAHRVVMVAEEQADDLAPYFGKDYRMEVVSNIIDTDFFAYRSRKASAGKSFVFCCLANFIPLKGYDVLFQAFESIRRQGCEAKLIVAGVGTDSRGCREMMASLVPSGGIEALGKIGRQQVRDMLYRSDCMVLASRSEAQPLSLLEAMSTGLPVIATTCVPQSLRLEKACLVVPIDDVSALADVMMKMCSETFTDGEETSRQVAQMASPSAVGKRLSEILVEAAQQEGTSPS